MLRRDGHIQMVAGAAGGDAGVEPETIAIGGACVVTLPSIGKAEAAELTEAANAALSELESLLAVALEQHHAIDWNALKDRTSFAQSKPQPPKLASSPPRPKAENKPRKEDMPKLSDRCYRVEHSILDDFFPWNRSKKVAAARARFEADLARWKSRVDRWNQIVQRWNSDVEEQKRQHAMAVTRHQRAIEQWEIERREFLEPQWLNNKAVDAKANLYANGDPAAIYDYCDKPLTLLNGGNLLHLLQKHGHQARINVHEAKKLLASR